MSDRELRDVLESTQAELERARARLEELEAQSTEALEARIAQYEEGAAMMRARLEQGDAVRETWATRQAILERELSISRTEQQRLQSQLETIVLERKLVGLSPTGRWRNRLASAVGVVAVVLIALALIGMLLLMLLR